MPVTHFPTSARRNYGNTRTVIPAQAGIRTCRH
ncbi:pilin, partial [Neisseria gonorrhoeae]